MAEGNPVMELKIFNLEDRLNVAQILIKNGYTVSQGKRARTQTGKTPRLFSESPGGRGQYGKPEVKEAIG